MQGKAQSQIRAAAVRRFMHGGEKVRDGTSGFAGFEGEPAEVEVGEFLQATGRERFFQFGDGLGGEPGLLGLIFGLGALGEQAAGRLMPVIRIVGRTLRRSFEIGVAFVGASGSE